MRHGTQLAPDGSVPNSHELARCAACESILYDVPVLLDGIPLGKVAWRCPHCHDGRPLDPAILRRQQQVHADVRLTPAEAAAFEAYQRRSAAGAQTKRTSRQMQEDRVLAALRDFYATHGRAPTYAEMGHSDTSTVPGLSSFALIVRLFGTARRAFAVAGIPTRLRGTPGRPIIGQLGSLARDEAHRQTASASHA